nr:hypothetical protein [Tanacetum cinerariifolium]
MFRNIRGNGRLVSTRRIRVASWNVGSLTGKLFKIVVVLGRNRVDVAFFEETKWKGSSSREGKRLHALVFSGDLRACKDCKVYLGEACSSQHRLVALDALFERQRHRREVIGMSRILWKNLNEDSVISLKARVLERLSARGEDLTVCDRDQMWDSLSRIIKDATKDSLGVATKDSLGVASGSTRTQLTRMESWWFSEEGGYKASYLVRVRVLIDHESSSNQGGSGGIDNAKEKTIPLRDIISQLPLSIVITTSPPVLPIEDPEDSLIMGNEELSTIPKKESNEVIKSNVEDFVPIPSESEDTSRSDRECDLPSRDDFSPINIPEGQFVTFSNPLFNSNDDFTSSDDKSLSDEDVPKDNVKIDSNLLFEFDDEYISSEVNPLFDKVLEDIESKDSYDSNLDEPALLVTPFSILIRMSVSTWEAMLMKLMLLIFLWILRTVIVDPF